ncbi:hypothetical protein [Blastomonas sp. SL216]|uniref:hypothetical protein n=1 Tax=Blastomonas sp. SL216 TaxID=2995169 RepID=UPI002377303E|nr:hypothetical protein OU999_12680 [Blastomonas sp. SL216]
MHHRFSHPVLAALISLGLAGAPLCAQSAQPGKKRTATAGKIDDFTFLYSVQNQVPSCAARLVDAQGKAVSFTVRNGTKGKVYAVVLPRPAFVEAGTTAKVQITAKGDAPWSGELDGLAGPSEIEAAIAKTSGLLTATASFTAMIGNFPLGQWVSLPHALATQATSLRTILAGLDTCLAGRPVI